MPVEFCGLISTRDESESRHAAGPAIDPDFTVAIAKAHEAAGFEKVLIGTGFTMPDTTQVATIAAAHTERLAYMIAVRPGTLFPTIAAKQFATFDHLTRGRTALNIVSGGNDAELQGDGDYLSKDERYSRTDEWLTAIKKLWSTEGRVSHEGEYYRFENNINTHHPYQPSIPIYFGGSSEAAYRVGAKHADTYALWGEPLAETAEQIATVREAAAAAGRTSAPGISVSFRPILGRTDAEAWERAQGILTAIEARIAAVSSPSDVVSTAVKEFRANTPANVGSQRLLAAAAKGDRHDRALWTATAKASGAGGNSTALVGSPETVAAALLDYVNLGATTLLIRGYDPYDDTVAYGRDLIPLVRAEVARRDAASSLAAAV